MQAPESNEIIEKFKNKVICGDCLEVMKEIPDNSIDTIITDPPYGLSNYSKEKIREALKNWLNGKEDFIPDGKGFMGKSWDSFVPPLALWKECFRVMKPGATILVFAGTRTYDLMTISLRLSGFEIKDTLMWLYGSGFPKATDISKQIDKMKGAEREIIGENPNVIGRTRPESATNCLGAGIKTELTKPATPEAKFWNGWKSHGLKPAYEPIIMAMKPNEGSYAENALKWGVAGLNIDGGRIETKDNLGRKNNVPPYGNPRTWSVSKTPPQDNTKNPPTGRFPANVILECTCDEVIEGKEKPERIGKKGGNKGSFGSWAGSTADAIGRWPADKQIIHTNPECPCYMLDEQSGIRSFGNKPGGYSYKGKQYQVEGFIKNNSPQALSNYGDTGGASRFFYVAKASKSEREVGVDKNNHPTVKPIKLIDYLVKLTKMPNPNQVYLDPFLGSGTTAIAVVLNGRHFIGIEREPEYVEIAKKRIKYWGKKGTNDLFGDFGD